MAATLIRSLATLILIAAAALHARQPVGDAALLQFQRAADSYAFQHRQTERRGAAPAPLVEGAFFTPQVEAAFRDRIRKSGCDMAQPGDSAVPRPNGSTEGTRPLAACLSGVLPALPPELEYRSAGVALILADAHLHLVVDVLHAALPRRDH